ncbi:MAG: ribosome-associated translation inhibitor RaiA [Candidatus Eisenbacteria bacterium]|nr:ribosome-associated translation inhibitor RaiA [Candidatus Latescibacterota bacterium]MBD3302588.1 ribosome-associated translation inhibitor RaiA [Candidatus Eisenbacteria bacterium]
MEIVTTARRFQLTPQLKEHAHKRLQKLGRYFNNIIEAHLVLDSEKHRQIAELTVHAHGTELISREETPDMISSIDRVTDRIERQIKKYNARLKDRKVRRPIMEGPPITETEIPEGEPEEEWGPVVVRGNEWHRDPISVEEAIRALRESNAEFLMFRNDRNRKVGLVYTRPDGNFGFIEEEA